MYDKNNVFAKIIRGEIPAKKIYENDYAMSFYDVNPVFENHVLIIPKGDFENILDFARHATPVQQSGFWDCFVKTADMLGIECEFNCLANSGANAPFIKQSVFHFHMHLVSGEKRPEYQAFLAGL